MAEDSSSDQEKTEPATPRRLDKARDEGQIPRSRELATFMLLLGGVIGLWSLGEVLAGQLGLVMEQSFLFDRNQALDTGPMLMHAATLGAGALTSLLPLFLLLALLALAAPLLLGGWSMTAKSLKPQFSRLNPLKGLKRQFSSQALAELAKAIAKSVLVGGVVVAYLSTHRGEFFALMDQPVRQALGSALGMAAAACGFMVLVLVVVILIDVPYQLWSHHKKLRMSKEEIKREHKESEGDPQLKARIRAQQQSLARSRMMSQVPSADVIVTNPTHFAVALRYDEKSMSAPRVVAKGRDAVALRIRELGREHRIPELSAPALARSLYRHVDLEREVPIDLYTAVAEVMAWAFRLRREEKSGGELPPEPVDLPIPDALQVPAVEAGA